MEEYQRGVVIPQSYEHYHLNERFLPRINLEDKEVRLGIESAIVFGLQLQLTLIL